VAEPKIKGLLLGARLMFLNAQGAEKRGQVLGRLSPADRAILTGVLLPNSWFGAGLLHRLDEAIAETLVQGKRGQLYRELGRFSAQSNLGPDGIQRAYLREGDVHFLLRHVPRMYSYVHADGRRTYESAGERAAIIRTLDSQEVDADECRTTIGWLERGIELSGGQDVRVVEVQCRAKGAPHCEYHCSWEEGRGRPEEGPGRS